jgi:protein-S-isoprenylcysteine O-methyltransferase Ste14
MFMKGKNDKNSNKDLNQGRVHFVLFKSYTMYLFGVVLGVVFDLIIPFDIFSNKFFNYLGLILIILGSLLAYWAQKSSRVLEKDEEGQIKFDSGPYKYLRSPTHFGLFVMTLGLALVINSLFSILFTLIAQVISHFFFIKKQQTILEKKYGDNYANYKNKIKNRI